MCVSMNHFKGLGNNLSNSGHYKLQLIREYYEKSIFTLDNFRVIIDF